MENLGKMAYGKLLQPLNQSYLPNWDANALARGEDPFFDKGSRYTVPYTVYTTGIGVPQRPDHRRHRCDGQPLRHPVGPGVDGQTHLLNGARDTLSAAQLRHGRPT